MLAATANLTDALKARISMDPVLALAASVQLLTDPLRSSALWPISVSLVLLGAQPGMEQLKAAPSQRCVEGLGWGIGTCTQNDMEKMGCGQVSSQQSWLNNCKYDQISKCSERATG